jgi:3-oxoacyl-[acyl-carrier protein] reductase
MAASRPPIELIEECGSKQMKDRVAIVTGAASGIGRAIAQRFHDEGAAVFAVDRNAETQRQLPPESDRWAAHLSDVSIKGVSAPLIAACVTRFGRLDILVNNAGVGNSKPAHQTSDEDLDYWINANLSGTFRLSRDALPQLRGRTGVILNMASGLGLVGMAKQAAYSSAKAAIIGLTRQMAAEYGPDGVRVNAVAPGLIELRRPPNGCATTPITGRAISGRCRSGGLDSHRRWRPPRPSCAAMTPAS